MIATMEVPGSLGSSCTLTYLSAKIAPTPQWSRASSGSPDSARPGTASSSVSSLSSSPSSSSSDDSSEAQPLQVVPFDTVAAKQGGTKRRKMSAGSSSGSTSDGDEVLVVGYGDGGTRHGNRGPKRFRSDAHLSDYLISEGKDVDDHFKQSLGEDYDSVFEGDSVAVKKRVFNGLRQKYAVKPRDASPPAQSDPNPVVICEEEVEDHFFKSLGTAWESIQNGRRYSDDPSDASV